MAVQRNPKDPYDTRATNDELLRRRQAKFDNELQADPELADATAGGGRMALFAIAVVAILGVVFYGLNNPSITSTPTAQTTTPAPTTGTASTTRTPAGQTTGSAMTPSQPSTTPPPASYGDNTKGDTSGATQLSPGSAPSESAPSPSAPASNN